MSVLGFLRPKPVVQQDIAAIEAQLRREAKRIAVGHALDRERCALHDGIQIIQSQSRRLTAMANAMALTRNNASG